MIDDIHTNFPLWQFAMGLNMPAKTVVFTAVKKWDGDSHRFIGSGEYIQVTKDFIAFLLLLFFCILQLCTQACMTIFNDIVDEWTGWASWQRWAWYLYYYDWWAGYSMASYLSYYMIRQNFCNFASSTHIKPFQSEVFPFNFDLVGSILALISTLICISTSIF